MDSPSALARSIAPIVKLWRGRARVRQELAARSERELQDGKIKEIKEYCDSTLVERVLGPFLEAQWRAVG